MSLEDIKAKGLKVWYVKDKKSGKYISNKYDCSYEYTDEPYIFCMSLACLHNHLTKPHFSYYSREGNKVINNIASPLNIDNLEIIEA